MLLQLFLGFSKKIWISAKGVKILVEKLYTFSTFFTLISSTFFSSKYSFDNFSALLIAHSSRIVLITNGKIAIIKYTR